MNLNFNNKNYILSDWFVSEVKENNFFTKIYFCKLEVPTSKMIFKKRSVGRTESNFEHALMIIQLAKTNYYQVMAIGHLMETAMLYNKIYNSPKILEHEIEQYKTNLYDFLLKHNNLKSFT